MNTARWAITDPAGKRLIELQLFMESAPHSGSRTSRDAAQLASTWTGDQSSLAAAIRQRAKEGAK